MWTIFFTDQLPYLWGCECRQRSHCNYLNVASFLCSDGLGEKVVHLHADNCGGQNKNHYMMCYLMWCVLIRLHDEITISFLPVKHTKFFPDAGFGLLKVLCDEGGMSFWHSHCCQPLSSYELCPASWRLKWPCYCAIIWLDYVYWQLSGEISLEGNKIKFPL